MDEPTTFLDASCQYEMLDMIKELMDKGKCVVVVLHDIAQAVRVADRLILLADGESVYCGQSEDFAKRGALEKYMDLSLHKITVDGEEISFVTKKR